MYLRFLVIALLLLASPRSARSQYADPLRLIEMPTAGVLAHGAYSMDLRLYSGGGVLAGIGVGLRDAIQFGFAFGGTGVLGADDPEWNPRAEFQFRWRVLRESFMGPAIGLGFDSQGHGFYDEETDRYQVKSRGFYGVASKHFIFLGELGLHGGMNYSLERDDDDEDLDLFLGIEKSIGPDLDFITEYDLATNDNKDDGLFGEGKGYLSAAILWRVSQNFQLQFDFRNLLENHEGTDDRPELAGLGDWSREIQIRYVDYF